MTPREKEVLSFMGAAEDIGLVPVVELRVSGLPVSVDLCVMQIGQVVAAMRVRVSDGVWRYEVPARLGGRGLYSWRLWRLVGLGQAMTPDLLWPLDYWWAQVPGAGHKAAPLLPVKSHDTPGWMRPGDWEERLGSIVGRPH